MAESVVTTAGEPALQDWGEVFSFRPERVLRPTSLDELKALLERVHRGELGGGPIRVPGSLHSCAQIVVSETLLDVSALPQRIDVEPDGSAVVATANVRLHDFLAELSRHGKSVTATGGTDAQTLAGLISTATAPASARNSLYALLDWVELVTIDAATGRAVERRIARGEPDFDAVICSLGALGVLTRVRFRTVDERHFRVVMKKVHLRDVLTDLEATSARYDFWRVNWLPRSQTALLWAATEIPASESDPDGDYDTDEAEHVLDFVFRVLDKLGDTGPLLNRWIEGLYDGMALVYGTHEFTGPLRTMLPVDRRAPLHVSMAEWSFRPTDLPRVMGECEEYFERHGWPNIPTEIELSQTHDALMSPWNWPGLDFVVKLNFMYLMEVCTKAGEKERMVEHLRGLWNHLTAAGIDFKAHWGKVNFIDPAFAARQHELAAFRPLMSPLFVNPYLRERLG